MFGFQLPKDLIGPVEAQFHDCLRDGRREALPFIIGGPPGRNGQAAFQDARLHGFDLSGFTDLGRTANWGQFALSGVVSYVHGTNRTTGDKLYGIMPLNARAALTQRLGAWTGTAELVMVTAKTRVSAVRNELPTAGYGLVNLRGSYEWKQVRLDFGIDNLFDRFYNHPQGGAYVGQGMTMAGTAVPWGVRVPGMGRSFNVGVTVKF